MPEGIHAFLPNDGGGIILCRFAPLVDLVKPEHAVKVAMRSTTADDLAENLRRSFSFFTSTASESLHGSFHVASCGATSTKEV